MQFHSHEVKTCKSEQFVCLRECPSAVGQEGTAGSQTQEMLVEVGPWAGPRQGAGPGEWAGPWQGAGPGVGGTRGRGGARGVGGTRGAHGSSGASTSQVVTGAQAVYSVAVPSRIYHSLINNKKASAVMGLAL